MQPSYLSLIPPVIVLIIALVTYRVLFALGVGIIVAGFIAAEGNMGAAVALLSTRLYEMATEGGHVATFGFLVALGVLIQVMTYTGGVAAYITYMRRWLRTPMQVEQASIFLSGVFFVDDYLSNLMVGAVMRPLADSLRVARVKLAFLVDAMSGPLCVLIPATSWVAFIVSTLDTAGVKAPFTLYLSAMPYLFYPIALMVTVALVIRLRLSFGKMAVYEAAASEQPEVAHDLVVVETEVIDSTSGLLVGSLVDFLLPMLTLVVGLVCGVLITGDSWLIGGSNGFMAMMQGAPILWVLCGSGCAALVVSVFYALYAHRHFIYALPRLCYQGLEMTYSSGLLLLGAWTLGALVTHDLQTGHYVATNCLTVLSPSLLPLVVAILSGLITAATGSVWGAISLMIPLLVPLAQSLCIVTGVDASLLLAQLLGAMLSGSIAGSHFSPIADTVVATAISTECTQFEHLSTLMEYATPAAVGACVGALVSGLLSPYALYAPLAGTAASVLVTVLILFILVRRG